MSHEEQDHKKVQGSMEPPQRRRGHLGMRRRLEGKVSRLLCKLVQISGTRFLLRGVGLLRPETCEFRKILKLLFLKQALAKAVAFILPYIISVVLSALVTECI
jgi:hypothetical protein